MSKIIEVLITKRKKTYLATCDIFPGCQGIGNTQQHALEKLSGSIGKFIGNAAKETFKNTLTSVHYTEILLDQTQKKDQQKIAFNINGKGIGNPVSFLLKLLLCLSPPFCRCPLFWCQLLS